MKVAVLGCGAIGGLFLGYLTEESPDVVGVVKDYQLESLLGEGLIVESARVKSIYKVKVDNQLKEKVDLAIFSSKIGDLETLIKANLEYLKDATVISTQNGVSADYILNKYFPEEKIISGIVMFGATFYRPNRVIHHFKGNLTVGNIFGKEVAKIKEVVDFLKFGFDVSISNKIKGAKYLKLFINLNNCLPAILGLSMQETFSDLDLAKIAIKLNKEAYDVVKNSGIELADLPTYPKARLEGLVSINTEEAAGIFSKVMTSLSKEPFYGSILQSIKHNKPSEIDYINGAIVDLATKNNLRAPINIRIVKLVHRVEKAKRFYTKEELLKELRI
ncbi:MAG: ketopantoate reductase family protein [Candidatus Omnitrophica bacterium]|nr:ketopantoate reductase family protein [Candidatus Omnitrophota bacterium]